MNKRVQHTISLCMGSSCFANGNVTLLEQIKQFLQDHNLLTEVELKGNLCQGNCKDGPVISIDGKLYIHLTPKSLTAILKQHLFSSQERST